MYKRQAVNRSHIPVTKSDADFINGINTIDDCRTGTYGNHENNPEILVVDLLLILVCMVNFAN